MRDSFAVRVITLFVVVFLSVDLSRCSAQRSHSTDDQTVPVKREELRYGGKGFDHWSRILQTELKSATRMEALRAIQAFSANGYSKESATLIMGMLRTIPVDLDEQDMNLVLQSINIFRKDAAMETEETLVKGLTDSHRNVRYFSTVVMAIRDRPLPAAAIPAMVDLTLADQDDLGLLAVPALANSEHTKPFLQTKFKDPAKTKKLVDILTRMIDQETYGALMVGFVNADLKELGMTIALAPTSAVMLLGELGPAAKDASSAVLAQIKKRSNLFNPTPIACAHIVGKLGLDPDQVLPSLIQAMNDSDGEEARTIVAMRAVESFGSQAASAIPALRTALTNSTSEVMLQAYLSLDQIEGKANTYLPGVLANLKRSASESRQKLYKYVPASKSKGYHIEGWISLLAEAYAAIPEDRVQIAQVLGEFGPSAIGATKRLSDSLNDADNAVRRAAQDALEKIRTK